MKTLPPTKVKIFMSLHVTSDNIQQKAKHTGGRDNVPIGYSLKHAAAAPASPRRVLHHSAPPQPPRNIMNDDAHFFDRVKLFMTDRDIYNEFLKLVNLFAQDFIDTPRLVKESRNFLGNTELYRQFLNILGWDEKKEMEHYRNEQSTSSGWSKPVLAALPVKPGRVDMAEKYGSYRKVSANVCQILPICNH